MANEVARRAGNAVATRPGLNSELTFTPRGQPMIANARLIWRNFSGAEKQFNPAGKRNVTLVLDEQMFAALSEIGLNVKRRPPRQEGDDDFLSLEITVNYSANTRDPKLLLITSLGRTLLDGDTVGALDFAVIQNADIVINPYAWNVNGNTGVKAYMEQGYFTIEENDFERKYADIPDANGQRTDTEKIEADYEYDFDGNEI